MEQQDTATLKELKVLLKYMVNHTASHNKELNELASSLKEKGLYEEYNLVMSALKEFNNGNEKLSLALSRLEKGE